jgi:hypothetical protein
VRGNQEMLCFLTRPKVVSGLEAGELWGSGVADQIRALGSADPRHTCPAFCPPGTHPRRGHGPPPRRTAGTTLSSTLADAARRAASSASVCEHLLMRRRGAGRPFASAPRALGFVCELSVQCGMPRGISRGLRQRQSMHWCEASQQQALYTVGLTNYGFRPLTCTERELPSLTRSHPLNAFALAAAATCTFRASAHPKRVHASSPFRLQSLSSCGQIPQRPSGALQLATYSAQATAGRDAERGESQVCRNQDGESLIRISDCDRRGTYIRLHTSTPTSACAWTRHALIFRRCAQYLPVDHAFATIVPAPCCSRACCPLRTSRFIACHARLR